jgi:choline dehydrogenase
VLDSKYHGIGGEIFVQPAPDPTLSPPPCGKEHVRIGIPTFETQNGSMMEGGGGCSLHEMQVRDGKRQSIFCFYVFPYVNRANIAMLTHIGQPGYFEGKRAKGLRLSIAGKACASRLDMR